jgi:hypothetical protein
MKSRFSVAWTAVGITGAVLLLVALFGRSTGPPVSRSAPPKPAAEITSWGWSRYEYGSRSITGMVHNNCATAIPSIQVIFDLFDADGARVGQTSDVIFNLAPQGDWRFKAPIFEEAARSARPEELCGQWY